MEEEDKRISKGYVPAAHVDKAMHGILRRFQEQAHLRRVYIFGRGRPGDAALPRNRGARLPLLYLRRAVIGRNHRHHRKRLQPQASIARNSRATDLHTATTFACSSTTARSSASIRVGSPKARHVSTSWAALAVRSSSIPA